MKIIEVVIALGLILAAIYTFVWHDLNSWLISVLLILSAFITVSPENDFKEFLRKIRLPLLFLLFLKLLLFG